MPASLFTKPSSPLLTRRQVPQHSKMRLSYILNSSPPPQTTVVQPVVSGPVSLLKEPVSDFPSSPCSSGFGDAITTLFISNLESDLIVGSSALYNPPPPSRTSSPHELPHESHRSCYPSLLASEDLIPPPNSFVPALSSDSLRHSLLYNPNNYQNSLGVFSPMNGGATPILRDCSVIHPALHVLPPLQPSDLNILPNNSLPHPESRSTGATPFSSTITHRAIPQHPTTVFPNQPSSLNEQEETVPGLVELNPIPTSTSRSPSPTLSDSPVSSPSTSLFHFNGSPNHTPHPLLDSPCHNESQLPSPATTPPSSPPPVPHPSPDLPQMVQPAQLLP
ncbi:hypothetical protein Clacol_003404 [Clathrus columnatus]|uniref:Uncharacterized protein n=1 Tax=Clathrus columnatus TaxID=1419009 RepID=A0AAV5A3J8_9AGAM|nr:hypothetical protein Clacol_003404 [Clathrus columnatus]